MAEAKETWDVVIVGGGLAGMIVANICRERGLKTLVLEKGNEKGGMGNARISTGMLSLAGNHLENNPRTIEAAIREKTDGEIDPQLAKSIADSCNATWRWLVSNGLQFVKQPNGGARVAPPGYNFKTRIQPNRGTELWMQGYYDRFLKRGGEVMLGSRATDLKRRGDGWSVEVTKGGKKLSVTSRAVCICDGGFQADPELVDRYVAPGASKCLVRSQMSQTGDGLTMAMKVGASTKGFGRFYGHVTSGEAFEKELWPYPWMDAPALHSLLINRNGNVLKFETDDGIKLANLLAHAGETLGWFCVMSEGDWKKFGAGAPSVGEASPPPPYPYLEQQGGTVHRASSLEELARKAGLPPAILKATYAEYVAARLEVERSPTSFVAFPVVAGITFTMGGISIDPHGRVTDKGGKPIEGLYAAGSTVGGIHGGPRGGYLGGLAVSMVTAYIAGNSVFRSD